MKRIPQKETPPEDTESQSLSERIYEELGCTETLTWPFIRIVLEDIQLFDKKQHDRGPGNIARFGEKGIIIRMTDKMERINTIVWEGKEPKVSEPVEQEYADMSVYGVIARMVRKGEWK